jgi:hypothetical protein
MATGEHIFHAMIKLCHEHFFACLGKLSLCDVPSDFRCTYDRAFGILDGRDR